MSKIHLFLFLFFLGGSCYAQQSKENLSKERLRLKNYAFCQCLQNVFKGDTLFFKDGSTSGYFETGAYSIHTYTQVDSIAKVHSLKTYSSYGHFTLGIMKCLDFYNSKELEKIIISFDSDLYKK